MGKALHSCTFFIVKSDNRISHPINIKLAMKYFHQSLATSIAAKKGCASNHIFLLLQFFSIIVDCNSTKNLSHFLWKLPWDDSVECQYEIVESNTVAFCTENSLVSDLSLIVTNHNTYNK